MLWGGLVTLSGYWLGNVPFVADNIEVILLAFVFVSVLPILYRVRAGTAAARASGTSSEEPAA